MMQLSMFSIIGMISHVIFIAITWRAMQAVNFDPLIRKGKIVEARVLLIFIAIAVGTTVSNFVLDILQWSQTMPYLFQ